MESVIEKGASFRPFFRDSWYLRITIASLGYDPVPNHTFHSIFKKGQRVNSKFKEKYP